ncbi:MULTISPECIES: hypothetical protein [Nocardiopsidaceae]|uniref:Uncharacterized protein n=2 Tax=Nocardiopsidaceae TaxID=83676 RepID=A0ABY6YPI8_9ACTN|nr:hypothetical protein [Streptomonospora nanhaiensis]MEE2045037.1 hypothetical protein [Nocardiopsis tropica]WAE74273.1 hypothetical protein OUQ99_03885 [Streptomonospora nanhaiensis]
MFRIVISRLTHDGLHVTPEQHRTAMSVDEAVLAVRQHLPTADTGALRGDAVQTSVNRVNDFRRDVRTGDGDRFRVVIAPMM